MQRSFVRHTHLCCLNEFSVVPVFTEGIVLSMSNELILRSKTPVEFPFIKEYYMVIKLDKHFSHSLRHIHLHTPDSLHLPSALCASAAQ